MKIGVMFGNPETTTGGNALKFYASVRLDIRRIGAIKDREEVVGNQTRVKVVKNKVAPPFKQVEFDIMYGEGISKIGELIDLGVKAGIVEKSGAWFSYDSQRIGQGRENAKTFLQATTRTWPPRIEAPDPPERRPARRAHPRERRAVRRGPGRRRGLRPRARATAAARRRAARRAATRELDRLCASPDDVRGEAPAIPARPLARRCGATRSRGRADRRRRRLPDRALVSTARGARRYKARAVLAATAPRPMRARAGVMSGVNEIRSHLPRLFRASNGHEVVASSPLVPRNDPTLMFTNAGMVQFKNVFTGQEKRALRARRHLAEVRARRRQAQRPRQCRLHRAPPHLLRDARQFLLRRLFQGARDRARLEPDHQGIRPRPRTGCWSPSTHEDDEALRPLEEDRRPARRARSSASPTSDNFWAMGDTGPCGPCSEIFYDHGDQIPGGPPGLARARTATASSRSGTSSSCSSSRWRRASASPLPKPSIDTGMGLERIAAVLQGTHDNYETDLFAR